ncbi:nitric oxide reductase transcriptional regulator NorR [Alcaligenes sp. WGS1538]|uniref:nitric oxide reductase transcriptional regulator NorR n=1 Tax=Alcaligenes sp. WGS1538 TaxID=3366811 RepID=UPI00372CFFF1
MLELLIADLATDIPGALRLQRMVQLVARHFACDAVGLLKLDDTVLRIMAASGLSNDTMGRHFVIADHPRFARILASRSPIRFEPDCELPDPYDGLLDDKQGQPLPVHDCVGIALHLKGAPWGILTLDALQPGTFCEQALIELQRCSLVLESAIRVSELEEENRSLRLLSTQPAGRLAQTSSSEIIGASVPMLDVIHLLDTVADSELPVLLLGETGVGKELFARRLHQRSRRSHKPLVYVNCAALPESLAESELFGHVKGAFSGAQADRAGRFEAAEGGTLFLDEIGELSLSVQAKLLRTLQNGEVQRLGADHPVKLDVRLVAATNRDLGQQVAQGAFRSDLFHRLSVFPLNIPPLRDRHNDILLLAGHFLEANRSRLGLRGIRLSPGAEAALLAYHWPGNVRELEHLISRAAIRLLVDAPDRNQIFTLDADNLGLTAPVDAQPPTAAPSGGQVWQPLRQSVDQLQRHLIRQALEHSGGNWSQAARRLGLDPSNLHKLAGKLGLKARSETFIHE